MKAFGKVMLVITPLFLIIGLVAAYTRYQTGFPVLEVFPDFETVLAKFSTIPSPSEYWAGLWQGTAAVIAGLPAQFSNVHNFLDFLGVLFSVITAVGSGFVSLISILAYPFVVVTWFLWSVVSLMLGI